MIGTKEAIMILVRNVFQLEFGKAKEAKELWKEGSAIAKKVGYGSSRAMMDLTGPFYTFVMENTFESLSAYDKSLKDILGNKEWSNWYQKFAPLVESGRREIYTVLE